LHQTDGEKRCGSDAVSSLEQLVTLAVMPALTYKKGINDASASHGMAVAIHLVCSLCTCFGKNIPACRWSLFPDAFIGIDLIVMAVKKEIPNFITMGAS
jgi:hypothetical protein